MDLLQWDAGAELANTPGVARYGDGHLSVRRALHGQDNNNRVGWSNALGQLYM